MVSLKVLGGEAHGLPILQEQCTGWHAILSLLQLTAASSFTGTGEASSEACKDVEESANKPR